MPLAVKAKPKPDAPAVVVLMLLLASVSLSLSKTTQAQSSEAQEPHTIMVTGRLPGPRLWKVSKGDHALYIFGYLSVLPKRMRWDSQRVEAALAQSQEFIGMLESSSRSPLTWEVLRNPEDQKLEDVLPAASWDKYLAFTREHFRRDRSIEKLRPVFAVNALINAMYDKHDLTAGDKVLEQINKLARRNRKLRFTDPNLAWPGDLKAKVDAAVLAMYSSLTEEEATSCFDSGLDRVMGNINLIKQAANAWAQGETRELEYLLAQRNRESGSLTANSKVQDPCSFTVYLQNFENEVQAFGERKLEQWLSVVEKALMENTTSFSILTINQLLDSDGPLEKLRERGYDVQEPQ